MFAKRAISSRLFLYQALTFCKYTMTANASFLSKSDIKKNPLDVTLDEWKSVLPANVFHVAREAGTESPHSGQYNTFEGQGIYSCACCGAELFRSDAKFMATCGWPSFHTGANKEENIIRKPDFAHGMERTEVQCKKCHAHLGHVFDDGPNPTGERFCINSVSIEFTPLEASGGTGGKSEL